MKFVEDLIDLGAPELFVTGLGAAEVIGGNCIRLTLYSELRAEDGTERHVKVHVVWPLDMWLKAQPLFAAARTQVMAGNEHKEALAALTAERAAMN